MKRFPLIPSTTEKYQKQMEMAVPVGRFGTVDEVSRILTHAAALQSSICIRGSLLLCGIGALM
jgi:hypothetical protein